MLGLRLHSALVYFGECVSKIFSDELLKAEKLTVNFREKNVFIETFFEGCKTFENGCSGIRTIFGNSDCSVSQM